MPHWTELQLTGIELTTHVLVHGAPFVFKVSVFELRSAEGGENDGGEANFLCYLCIDLLLYSTSLPVRIYSMQLDISIEAH